MITWIGAKLFDETIRALPNVWRVDCCFVAVIGFLELIVVAAAAAFGLLLVLRGVTTGTASRNFLTRFFGVTGASIVSFNKERSRSDFSASLW
jgi:hypothetical protein